MGAVIRGEIFKLLRLRKTYVAILGMNAASFLTLCVVGIIWLKNPLYSDDDRNSMGGQPRVDLNNSKKSLRTRPILGLEVMRSFEFDEDDGKWVDGRIYDPENGKEYRCQMTLTDPDTLDVYGYVKIAFIKVGRHTRWTRVKKES